MKIGFVIPSRLKSSRLKKKILMHLGGQSALEWTIDRAKASNSIDEVVVATTSLASDAEISKICVKKNIRYFQGSPEDVLLRLKDTAEYFDFDYVVNITPDNTLFSIYLIDLMVSAIKEDSSMEFIRFEDAMLGTGVYALKREALQAVCEFKNVLDTEIWGPLFHEEYFNVRRLEVPEFLKAEYRLTMDTELDYMMLSRIYDGLDVRPGKIVTLNQVIRFLDDHPDIASINDGVVQQNVSQQDIDKIKKRFYENEALFYSIKAKCYKGE
jgi:spore coat polysaccharide biosynthesis protein SpsF (cytidylyltransferase family)